MARPEKDDTERKKPRTTSMTDNEWGNLKQMAKEAGKETSAYVIEKLKIKNTPVKKES